MPTKMQTSESANFLSVCSLFFCLESNEQIPYTAKTKPIQLWITTLTISITNFSLTTNVICKIPIYRWHYYTALTC